MFFVLPVTGTIMRKNRKNIASFYGEFHFEPFPLKFFLLFPILLDNFVS